MLLSLPEFVDVCRVYQRPGWSLADVQLREEAVIERMERIGMAWRPEGEWIAGLDLVEEGDRLAVKEMGVVSA